MSFDPKAINKSIENDFEQHFPNKFFHLHDPRSTDTIVHYYREQMNIFKTAALPRELKISKLESQLSLASEIIDKLEKAVGFYGEENNWSSQDAEGDAETTFPKIFNKEDCELFGKFSDGLYFGGKLARATLLEVEQLKKKMEGL